MPIPKGEEETVLGFCNMLRSFYGKKPVKTIKKGFVQVPNSCPIAKTIGVDGIHVLNHKIIFEYSKDEFALPHVVRDFISDFDLGKKTRYELTPEEGKN